MRYFNEGAWQRHLDEGQGMQFFSEEHMKDLEIDLDKLNEELEELQEQLEEIDVDVDVDVDIDDADVHIEPSEPEND